MRSKDCDVVKQLVLNIPEDMYSSFINLLKSKFSAIKIKEMNTALEADRVAEDAGIYETARLSEKSLAEDWLSEEDARWDAVL